MATGAALTHPLEKVLDALHRLGTTLEHLLVDRHLGKVGLVALLLAWSVLARVDEGPTGSFIRSFSNFVMGAQ